MLDRAGRSNELFRFSTTALQWEQLDMCPDPEIVIVCVPNDWADSWGDDCEAYAANPGWCGYEESSDNCCVCGAGQETKSCEPAGSGGGYYAATLVSVTMKAVDFQRCSSGLAGGAAYLDAGVSANISASVFRDCVAQDGGASPQWRCRSQPQSRHHGAQCCHGQPRRRA